MAIDFQAIGNKLVTDLFAEGSDEQSMTQVVNKMLDSKLLEKGKAYDRDSVLFVDELNQRIMDNPNADAETLAGWRRLIVKYSS